jgi:hypothetical protein
VQPHPQKNTGYAQQRGSEQAREIAARHDCQQGRTTPFAIAAIAKYQAGKNVRPIPPCQDGGKGGSRFLLTYALSSWVYSIVFLVLMLGALWQFLGSNWSWLGIGAKFAETPLRSPREGALFVTE